MQLSQSVIDSMLSSQSLEAKSVVYYDFTKLLSESQEAEFILQNVDLLHPGDAVLAQQALSTAREMTQDEKNAVRSVLDMYEQYLNVKFIQVEDPDTSDLHFSTINLTELKANGVYMFGEDTVYLNNDYKPYFPSPSVGNASYKTLIHEVGHALGLNHPYDVNLDYFNTNDQTVMATAIYGDGVDLHPKLIHLA